MNDLISRQAAIDALCEEYCNGHHDCKYYPKCENLRWIQELPSAQPEITEDAINDAHNEGYDVGYWAGRRDYEPKWIPVTERLPIKEFEDGRKNRTVYDIYPCLVTRYSTHTDEPRTRTYVCKSYFDGEDFMLHGGYAPDEGSDTENTLAWMPLPEPWKGEDDAEIH